jgi:hypothetical protein
MARFRSCALVLQTQCPRKQTSTLVRRSRDHVEPSYLSTTQRGKACLTGPCICPGSLFHYPCHARSVPATRVSTLAGCRTIPRIHENLVQSSHGGRTPCTWMEMSNVVTRYSVMLIGQAKLRVDDIHKPKPMPLLRITRDSVGGLDQILGTQSLQSFGRTYARAVGGDGSGSSPASWIVRERVGSVW